MLTATPKTIFLKDYTPPAFLVSRVDLDVDLQDDHANDFDARIKSS